MSRPLKLDERQLAELLRRDRLRKQHGVKQICADLGISRSTFEQYKRRKYHVENSQSL